MCTQSNDMECIKRLKAILPSGPAGQPAHHKTSSTRCAQQCSPADAISLATPPPGQATSNEIAAKVADAERTESEIDAAREAYRPVAQRASLLFFCIADLAGVDPMYQYSLAWFSLLFKKTLAAAPQVRVAVRIQ